MQSLLQDELLTARMISAIEELHRSAGEPAVTQDTSRDWSLLRRRTPVNYMLQMSIAWLRTLPRDVRPMVLVKQYPRIANSIALRWNRTDACRAYFIDLFVDSRGTRKGFPADVHRDITTLCDYYCRQDLQLAE